MPTRLHLYLIKNPRTSSKVSGRDVTRLVRYQTICEVDFTQAAQLLHIDRETGFSESACAVERDLTTIILLPLLLGDFITIIHTLLCCVQVHIVRLEIQFKLGRYIYIYH